jgi:O-antigen/teichoic acid export membrane protein
VRDTALGRNYLAGLSNSIWSAIVTLAVVPFYLKYLGLEAYGLVGFLVFTQGIVQLLDLGLGPTISREVARRTAQGDLLTASQLLRTLAVVYWSTAAIILVCFVSAAPLIAEGWLNTTTLSLETVATATALIGVVIACRWPLGLYQGVLIGAQRLVTASTIGIAMSTFASVGAVVILAFVSPTVQALFVWQAVVAFVFSIVMMRAAWGVVGSAEEARFEWARLREIWRFSAGMSMVAITGVVLLQLDKAILSRMLGLEQFGQYMLAVLVANSLYVLLRPLFNTIYPRMTALATTGQMERLTEFYASGTRLLGAVLFPIAATISVYSFDLIYLWTGNRETATDVAPLAALLVWGTAFNGVMHFPYAMQLAFGRPRLSLTINAILIAVSAPITVVLTYTHGVIGGAASWAILNAIYVVLGTWLTNRLLMQGVRVAWLMRNVLVPLMVSWLVVGSAAWLVQLGSSSVLHLVVAAVVAFLAFAANVLMDRTAAGRFLRSAGLAGMFKLNL